MAAENHPLVLGGEVGEVLVENAHEILLRVDCLGLAQGECLCAALPGDEVRGDGEMAGGGGTNRGPGGQAQLEDELFVAAVLEVERGEDRRDDVAGILYQAQMGRLVALEAHLGFGSLFDVRRRRRCGNSCHFGRAGGWAGDCLKRE